MNLTCQYCGSPEGHHAVDCSLALKHGGRCPVAGCIRGFDHNGAHDTVPETPQDLGRAFLADVIEPKPPEICEVCLREATTHTEDRAWGRVSRCEVCRSLRIYTGDARATTGDISRAVWTILHMLGKAR